MVKHAGYSMHTVEGRAKYNRDELIDHFCKVNKCDKGDFLEHEKETFEIWEERSKYSWKQPWTLEFE